jgi:SNF2 family DNA or RNA helicase
MPENPKEKAMLQHRVQRTLMENFCCTKNLYILHYLQNIAAAQDKVIVFSDPTAPLYQLKLDLARYGNVGSCLVTGRNNARQNRETLERFQTDPLVRVLLISLKLGSIGLNIPWANHIIFLHPWWEPCLMSQAIARLLRFGQHKTVYVVHLVMNRTIEFYVTQRADNKKTLARSLLDEEDAEAAIEALADSGTAGRLNMGHLAAYCYRQVDHA